MNRIGNESASSEEFLTQVATALRKWYDANPDVRRLRATQHASAIHVFIELEPTPDGDDTLPVWLANSDRWTSDLRSLTNCDMRLEMFVSAAFDESDVDSDTATIAELSWRDPSASLWLTQ